MTYTSGRRPRRRRWQRNHNGSKSRCFKQRRLKYELLEDRRLLAIDLVIDYSLDTAGFFSDQDRKDALERAATVLESRLEDDLTAITPGDGNSWTATISHPETGSQHEIENLTIPADTVVVFVGSRNISNLGIGGPGGYSVVGTTEFVNNMRTRGESGIATGEDSSANTDFAPWGGVMTFDSDASWHFSADLPTSGSNDFYSVALHELGHVLGYSTASSWNNQINGLGQFTGSAAVEAHGSPVQLAGDHSHWAHGTTSTLPGSILTQETAFDPNLTVGTRKELTTLDWAALDDIGWQVAPVSFAPTLDSIDDVVINTDSSEQVIDLTGISAGGSEVQPLKVTAVSSDTNVVLAPTVTYTSAESTGTLTFTPVSDQSGTSTITVTVEDGGDDNNLDTAFDNETFSRSFVVTVSLSFDIVFDYSLDSTGFFADQNRKDALERAATVFETRLEDNLAPIMVDGGNTWTAVFSHPETGDQHQISDIDVPIDTVLIYVGSRVMSNLGSGGSGGYSVNGTSSFVENVGTRGQSGIATGSGDSSTNTDFAPWGGSVSFSRETSWNFGIDLPSAGINDFYSTALHEIAHVLGFGRADSWDNQINGSNQFVGTTAVAAHGSPVPLSSSQSHWTSGTTSTLPGTTITQEAALDPQITVGTRKELTNLDWAGLTDIGWEVAPVTSSNNAPTLDAINDVTIAEDASEQTVNLTGIGPGPSETESVRVTATSDNPGLVPTPTVNYTDGSATGTLKFTPVANQNGTATISVTVEDAGPDGNLNSSEDNLIITQDFAVTVTSSNDAPTIDAINNVTIAEDASEQTVNLTGIGPGPSETESVRVTATSDNPGLVPTPTVNYTDGSATGTLKFTPVANQNGTATISVTVEDAGPDGNLNSSEDNTSIIRSFDVSVAPVNDPPQASDVTYKPAENTLFVKGQADGLVTLVNDVESDNLTFSVSAAPTNGSLSLNADGSFSYNPDTNFNKIDSFDFVAHDGTNSSNIATVTLQIQTVFPWYNSDQPIDVNNDSIITPADALWIINIINAQGSHQLSATRDEGVATPYVDVNRDGFISAQDVLLIINHLNEQAAGGSAEGADDGGEGEANRDDSLSISEKSIDGEELASEANRQSLLPVQGPLQWQLVDDAYRSTSADDYEQYWLNPQPLPDDESDWWDFLNH